MSDRLNTTIKNRQNSDSTFKVNPFQSRGFVVQTKSEESTSATKAQLWKSYQQAKHLNQNSAKLLPIQAKDALTAHELTHVVQQTGKKSKEIQKSPLDWLSNKVGDALNTRGDEERLDAQEDMAAFMKKDYKVTNHHPATGRGLFDASYRPRAGDMTIAVKLCFQFHSGNPTNAEWSRGIGGAAAKLPIDIFQWQEGEADSWKANAIADIKWAWSERYMFHSTHPHWESLPNVNVHIDVTEVPADRAHYVITINKWPKDRGVRDHVKPPGADNNHSTAQFEESTDNGIKEPDVTHFRRKTTTRNAYQVVDKNNPGVILFDRGKKEVSVDDRDSLKAFGATLGRPEIPPFPVTLVGHASSEGKDNLNMSLSEDRARAVSNEIVRSGSKTQPTVTAGGVQGSDKTSAWRRVDITVGRFESDQRTVLHEFGHMLGLGDEYPTRDGDSRDVGEKVAHSYLAETLIPGQGAIVAHDSENIMSIGEAIEPHHYVTFLEALGTMTSTTGQWDFGPGLEPMGIRDSPRGKPDASVRSPEN